MMDNKKGFITILMLLWSVTGLFSCNEHELSGDDYIIWVNNPNNGLITDKVIAEYKFSMQYQPLDYLVLKDIASRNEQYTSIATFDSIRSQYEGMQYYAFRIGSSLANTDALKQSITDETEYYERVQYFSNHAQSDFSLIDGTDTLSCLIYHFEQAYSLTPYNTILLAFEDKDEDDHSNKVIVLNENILGVGRIQLTISGKSLKNIPQVKI